jgi:hypothetical protein
MIKYTAIFRNWSVYRTAFGFVVRGKVFNDSLNRWQDDTLVTSLPIELMYTHPDNTTNWFVKLPDGEVFKLEVESQESD